MGEARAVLWPRGAAVVVALVFAACGAGTSGAPLTARPIGVEVVLGDARARPAEQHPQPGPVSGLGDPDHQGHHGHHGHHGAGEHAAARADLPPSAELRRQLSAARRRAAALMSVRQLADADYYVGSYYSAGVGSHYINWPLLDEPFKPDAPTMVLVDTTPGHIPRLAGFSYWVRSATAPEGFAGDADQWHAHRGMCFIDDVLTHEDVPSPSECAGTWLDGRDLWMLHAWVVPGYENPDGVFAPRRAPWRWPRCRTRRRRCDPFAGPATPATCAG